MFIGLFEITIPLSEKKYKFSLKFNGGIIIQALSLVGVHGGCYLGVVPQTSLT